MLALQAERQMAHDMLGMFGDLAAQRASENAHLESQSAGDDKAAYWRRVTALIVGLQMHPCDAHQASS